MPTPIKLTIKFKADTIAEFVEKYGTYVSQGGLFVRTRKPLAVGTLLDFEFKLQNGDNLLKGLGTVVWTREHDPARKTAPAGMGLRYDSLDDESQEILEKILVIKSRDSVADETPDEESKEIVTSPGNQEEKTRVASMDVLNKLRGGDDKKVDAAVEEKSPSDDLFDKMDDLPKPTSEVEAVKVEVKDPEDKSGEDKKESEKWDEPTPIPSQIHPLIAEEEETNASDVIPVKRSEDLETEKLDDEGPDLDEDVSNALDTLEKESKPSEKVEKVEKAEKVEESEDKKDEPKSALVEKKVEKEVVKKETPSTKSTQSSSAKPVVTSEIIEEKSGGSAKYVIMFLILLIIAAGGFYYYKFVYLKNQDSGNKNQSVNTQKPVKKPVMKPVKVVDMTDMKVMEPDMKVTKPVVEMKPTTDSTPTSMVPDMAVTKDATKVVEMKPDAVEPPKTAPSVSCDTEKEVEAVFTTVPEGVTVYVNEEKVGKTPYSTCFKKKIGYSVKLSKRGWVAETLYYNKKPKNIKVHKQLAEVPRQIVIQSKPKKAIVFIDGQKMGPSTISKKFKVPQDLWKIEVQMTGYETFKMTVKKDDPKWDDKGYVMIYSVFANLKAK